MVELVGQKKKHPDKIKIKGDFFCLSTVGAKTLKL